jgi:hypothetical protein
VAGVAEGPLAAGAHVISPAALMGVIVNIQAPVRVTHTYTQTLDGTPAEVLPLLCPVREAEWVPGWSPQVVLSESGLVEPDCIFVTPDPSAPADTEAIWTVLQQDPAEGTVEMLKVTPGFLVVRLAIALQPHGETGCYATISYRYTALSPAGERYVRERTEGAYGEFMRGWESALNAYLRASRRETQR